MTLGFVFELLPTKPMRNIMPRLAIYGIKNCDTMKKARRFLDDKGVAYDFHDYKAEGVSETKLKDWAKIVGWEKLLNRAGTTFKKLPEEAKQDLNEAKAMTLMLAQPSMIKRPVLEAGANLIVGFAPDSYEQVLKR
jgi:arsenate reductase